MDRLEQLAADVGGGRIAPPCDEEMEKRFPFLWTLITEDQWGDGTARALSSVQVDRVPGGYRVTLQDHSLWKKKTCFAPTFGSIPQALETCLDDSNVPWEDYRSYRTKQGPKVKEKQKGGRHKKR